jgi:hypothetical protein
MRAILNISATITAQQPGLPDGVLSTGCVRVALVAAGYHIEHIELVQHGRERTFVVEVSDGWPYSTQDWGRIEQVSKALGLDCITAVPWLRCSQDFNELNGFRAGPQAKAQGPFDPSYFVYPTQGVYAE